MNIAAILREIDAEIEKLHKIREVLSELSSSGEPKTRRRKSIRREAKSRTSSLPSRPLPTNATTPAIQLQSTEVANNQISEARPRLVVLPPKTRRTKRYRSPPVQPVTTALSSTFPDKPVFVPKARSAASAPAPTPAFDPEALEAAIRRSLLDQRQATASA